MTPRSTLFKKIRSAISLLLVFMLALGMCACSQNAGNNTAESSTSATGGRLRIGYYIPAQLDPSIGWQNMNLRAFGVIQTLLWIDQDQSIQYELAEDMRMESPTVAIIKLRPNVKFHDGTDLDATDVVYSMTRVLSPENTRHAEFSAIEKVEALDTLTVRITTRQPIAALRAYLTDPVFSIIPDGYNDFSNTVVGTGPFVFTSWIPGAAVTVDRFDDYWDGVPLLAGADIFQINDDLTKTYQLLNGEIDIAYGSVVQTELDAVRNDPNLEIIPRIGEKRILLINTRIAPFDNKEARQALGYAINKGELVNLVLGAEGGTPATGDFFMTNSQWAATGINRHDQDIEKALELFAEAGVTDTDADGFLDYMGSPIVIDLITYDVSGFDYPAQIIREQLQAIGLQVNLVILGYSVAQERFSTGDFGLAFLDISYFDGEPSFSMTYFYGKEGIANLRGGYQNQEVWDLLEKGLTELDEAKRKAIYDSISRIVLDDMPVIYLYYITEQRGVNRRVGGYINYPNETLLTKSVFLKE